MQDGGVDVMDIHRALHDIHAEFAGCIVRDAAAYTATHHPNRIASCVVVSAILLKDIPELCLLQLGLIRRNNVIDNRSLGAREPCSMGCRQERIRQIRKASAERSGVRAEQPSLAPPGYQLLDRIGRGGMGVVYRAYDIRLKREVAVKLLRDDVRSDSRLVDRFCSEAELCGQLQHPGIPAVHELGQLPDGRPFLAMKLVKGRTLHGLLKEHRSSHSHAAVALGRLIAIFEQICHAVGYAHARQVIHRDLKPSNIMVGAFGEVQVMDWGLAKVVDASRSRTVEDETDPMETVESRTHIDTPPRDDSATRTGSVLGTPAYMAPEQAAGQIRLVDARSDVFGLGAILCEILTGEPPYRGGEGEAVRIMALRGETAAAIADLDACGAEPELVALCKRCRAFRQEDRPADGSAVAQEVARIRQAAEERARRAELERAEALVREAEGRKRRWQLLAAAAVILVTLTGGMAASLWQTNRAIQAERRAQNNEAKALAERDAKARALQAETEARQAEKEARDRAIAALRLMTDEAIEHQLARNATLTDENKEFLREVIRHFEGFAAITANNADSRAIRAEGYFRVGTMRHRLGELQEAEAAYRDALVLNQQLAAEFPDHPDYRRQLAASYNNLGAVLYAMGRREEAEAAYRDALRLRQQLATELPNRPDHLQELARSCNNLGALLYAMGRWEEAEAAYRDALTLWQQLAADFPNMPFYRQELARSRNNLGALLYAMGRQVEAEAAYRDALVLNQQLAAEFPARPDYRQELAARHNNLGTVLYATAKLELAEAAYRDALTLQKQLAAEFPNRPDYRQELARSYCNLGQLLSAMGRLQEAEAACRDGLVLQKQLAAEFPNRPDYRQELARCYCNLGQLLSAMGRLQEAEAAYRDGLTFQKQLAVEFASRPDYREELAATENNLANVLYGANRLVEAEAAYRDAHTLYQQLAAEFPSRPDYRRQLASIYTNIGILSYAQGRFEEAEASYGEGLAIYQQLAAEFPHVSDYQNEAAGTLVNLAVLFTQKRDFAAAKTYLDQALPHHQSALKADPQCPLYRQYYRNHLLLQVQVEAELLDPAAAVQAARSLRDLDWGQPGNTYDAACAISRCIGLVKEHEMLDVEQRQLSVQFYGDEAMRLLRDAVAKGVKDADLIKKDADLNWLRQREDFQKLLAELVTSSHG
ncbi:MAG: hypothetical protein KatS3mg109_0278 [Pirellulaceae bacterium]|nr:MAG: hypothetical protein KatS3mg109_0278 [Pirellulaceae bacterium]